MDILNSQLHLEITDTSPRAVYRRRNWDNKKTIVHWGQRKLLLSEILFLTRWGDNSSRVIYAGSAPGRHIPYLSNLFPTHHFTLVDPNPFGITETDHIKIINGYFDDKLALTYANQDILFISDMRTADFRQMSPLENEHYILKDNDTQMRWLSLMHPIKSMIKFRCPYPDVIKGSTSMFDGQIFVQPWAPPTSTETRLVIGHELKLKAYDNLKYEQQLFYHNTVARCANYSQPIRGEGLDQRFDASAEVVIINDFLTKFPHLVKSSVFRTISEMSFEISRQITESHRTLATPIKDPDSRRQFPKIDHSFFHKDK